MIAMGSTDVRAFILVKGEEEGNGPHPRVPLAWACMAARAEQRHTRGGHSARCRLIGLSTIVRSLGKFRHAYSIVDVTSESTRVSNVDGAKKKKKLGPLSKSR